MKYFQSSFIIGKVARGFALVAIVSLGLLGIVGSGGDGGGDDPGTLKLSSATYSVTEGTDPSVTVTVTRTGGSKGDVSVDYATADGTADSSDYSATTGTLSWTDGDVVAKTFTVAITDDSAIESSESFTVALSNVVTATLGTPNTATITIADDDNPGTLQFSSATYSATEGTDNTITITVNRTAGDAGAASVDYATADGSATQPGDYATATGTLNWIDGEMGAKTFTVDIANDSVAEPSEDFTVALSNVSGATLGTPNSATVTIADDDNPGTLQLSSATYSAAEGISTVTITVTRTGGVSGAVSVDYATADDTAVAGTDYTAISATTLNWADGDAADKTFTVTIIDDGDVELTESFNVILSNAVTATLGVTTTASVSITDNDTITVPISGTVSAPSGTLAYKEPGLFQHMFAAIFGKTVDAAIIDLVSPVAGATVSLYEVDASGSLVGAALDTDTTDGTGSYNLTAPSDALDSVKYIVRASGTTENMDGRITSTTINVNPSTDATSRMVALVASNLTDITVQEVIEMQEDIEELTTDIDKSALTATVLSDRLFNKALSMVGQYNVLRSKVSLGQICGHVQTAGTTPLEGILIIVHDYVDRTTRARTYTDASGDYCVNVPVLADTNPDGGTFNGEYIIGAINRTGDTTDPSISASEWLGSGTTYTEHEANKISVANTTPVSGIDFTLELGVRITGTVKGTGTLANLEGVQVIVRDFDSGRRLASTRVERDGTYRVSVIPGTYLIAAKNTTTEPFGSEYYLDSLGTNIGTQTKNFSDPVSAIAGDTVNIDFVLNDGYQLSGNIDDGAPVVDAQVTIRVLDPGGDTPSENVSTDRNGDYNIMLRSDFYNIYAHGQRNVNLFLLMDRVIDFTGSISKFSGQLQDSLTNPVSDGTIRIYRKDDPTTTSLMDIASSDSEGNFTAYTDQTGDHLIEARITNESDVGSIVYQGHTRQLSGDVTNIAAAGSDVDVGTVNMPNGGMLRGHVYSESFGSLTLTPIPNFRVQVRDDDDLATADAGNTLEDRFLQTRTQADGSYSVALPAGIYDRVKMRDATGTGNCGSPGSGITITSGVTTVLDFYDGDDSCH